METVVYMIAKLMTSLVVSNSYNDIHRLLFQTHSMNPTEIL